MNIVVKGGAKMHDGVATFGQTNFVYLYSRKWLEGRSRCTATFRTVAIGGITEFICNRVFDLAAIAAAGKLLCHGVHSSPANGSRQASSSFNRSCHLRMFL